MPSHRQLFLLRTSGRFRRTGCAVGRQSRQFLPLWQRVHAGSKTWLCSRLNHTLFFSSSGISPIVGKLFGVRSKPRWFPKLTRPHPLKSQLTPSIGGTPRSCWGVRRPCQGRVRAIQSRSTVCHPDLQITTLFTQCFVPGSPGAKHHSKNTVTATVAPELQSATFGHLHA